jgi:hypothetical protein
MSQPEDYAVRPTGSAQEVWRPSPAAEAESGNGGGGGRGRRGKPRRKRPAPEDEKPSSEQSGPEEGREDDDSTPHVDHLA